MIDTKLTSFFTFTIDVFEWARFCNELFSYACEHELICIRVKDRLPILLLKLVLPLLLLSFAYPAIHAQDSESDVIIGVLITFLATSYSKINDFVNESESEVSTEVADKVVDDYNKKKQ